MWPVKMVNTYPRILKLGANIFNNENVLKSKIVQYINNLHSVRKCSTQKIENAVPNISKAPPPSLRTSKRDNIDGFALLLLGIPVSAFCLGTWQVKRKKWKEDLIEELMSKTQAPAIDLPLNLENLDELEFRRVRVKGQFDHSGEVYVGPRSCIIDGDLQHGGKLISSSAMNSSGYNVVTPFILSSTKERILVNRGWVSFPQKNPNKRPEGQIQGEVELEGVVRKTEPRQVFVPPDKPQVKVYLTRNVETLAETLGTKPIFIDATAESTVPGGPIGGQTRASLRNEHLSYIFTWYGLSLATGIMWYTKYLK